MRSLWLPRVRRAALADRWLRLVRGRVGGPPQRDLTLSFVDVDSWLLDPPNETAAKGRSGCTNASWLWAVSFERRTREAGTTGEPLAREQHSRASPAPRVDLPGPVQAADVLALQRLVGNRAATRRMLTRDNGTASKQRPAAKRSHRPGTEDPDRALVAMGGSRYGPTVEQALSIATAAAVPHERVRRAMLHGARGAGDGDRAFAAAVFALAVRQGDPLVAEAIERGDLKVAEIPETALRAIDPDARAGYVPGGRDTPSLPGRTFYIPSTFRLDSVAQQGSVIHEIDHAGMDLLFTDNPAEIPQASFEVSGYMAEANFLIDTLRERSQPERTAALVELSRVAGPVLIRLMVAWALQASPDEFDDERAIVDELNTLTLSADPTSALDRDELAAAWRATAAENQESARVALERQLRREKRTRPVPVGRRLQRAPARVLARDDKKTAARALQEWTLLYVDKYGDPTDENGDIRWRRITSDDQEFQEDYVDNNIDHATIYADRLTGDYDKIEILYRNGARLVLDKHGIPNRKYWRPGQARVVPFDSFEKHEDGFIYPVYKGKVTWSAYFTPNIVSIREQADEKATELHLLYELMELTEIFAFDVMRQYSSAGHTPIEETAPHPTQRAPVPLARAGTYGARPDFSHGTPREEPTSRQAPVGGEEQPKTPMALPEPGRPGGGEPPQQQHQQQLQHQPAGRRTQQQSEQARQQGEQASQRERWLEQERQRQKEQQAEQARQQAEQQQSVQGEQRHQQQQQQPQARMGGGPMRTDEIAKRGYPLGFESRGQFKQFGEATRGVLRRAGYDDAEVGMQGSAATGFRESDKSPFDSGRVSDFDVAVVSPTLFAEAKSQGIQVRASGAVPHAEDHTTFALTPDQAAALGVGDLALPKTWRPFGGRAVNVMVFASRAAAIAKQPHTIWAR